MDARELTNELNRIPVRTIGIWIGLSFQSKGLNHCPFPDHPDQTPSFEIKPSGCRWTCYGCSHSGGSIDFVKTYYGTDFLTAKGWLAKRAHIGSKSMRKRKSSTITAGGKAASEDVEVVESAPDLEVYESVLRQCPLQDGGRKYLASRAIFDSTITKFGIGQLSNARALLGALIDEFGFDRVNAAGLLNKQSSPTNSRLVFSQDALLFPFFENERVVYLQTRSITGVVGEKKYQNLAFRRRRIYNSDALRRNRRTCLSLCEGVMDTLSAIELGRNAIGILGVNSSLTQAQLVQLRGRNVDILLDWDAVGEAASKKLQGEMSRYGIAATRKRKPKKNICDLNEYLVEQRGLK